LYRNINRDILQYISVVHVLGTCLEQIEEFREGGLVLSLICAEYGIETRPLPIEEIRVLALGL